MSVYATRDELRQDRARWKRKNRVKQLKRTIARLKREKEEAYHRLKREKEEADHRGHQAGYDLCFARSWF